MQPFTFIHAADLHLGTPFKGCWQEDVDQHVKDRIVNATFTAFNNMVELAINKKVDFIVIAGDIVDSEDRNLWAKLKFKEGMMRLHAAKIPVYVVHGNHDPFSSWSEKLDMPENVHRFSEKTIESKVFDKNEEPCAVIHGMSFSKREVYDNLAQKINNAVPVFIQHNNKKSTDVKDDLFHLGLIHCSVGTVKEHRSYAECSLKEDLLQSDIDYWALGHVHTRNVLHKSRPVVIYPGNTQGLHINETGERGCFVVDVDDKKDIRLEFTPLDDVRWYKVDIDIQDLTTDMDLEKRMTKVFDGCMNESGNCISVAKVYLTGRGELHDYLRESGNEEDLLRNYRQSGLDLDPPVLLHSLNVQTRRAIDFESRSKEQDFIGDFLKIVKKIRQNPEMQDDFLESLSELYGNDRAKKHLDKLDEAALSELINEAESLCLDKLIGDEL